MRITHNIQHGGEREIDSGECGGRHTYMQGDMNFQSPQQRHKSITDLYPHNCTSTTRQHSSYTTHGERTQDITEDWGGGGRVGGGVTEIHYVVPTSFISTRSRDGAPGVPALDQRALPCSLLPPCASALLRCVPGPKRRSI